MSDNTLKFLMEYKEFFGVLIIAAAAALEGKRRQIKRARKAKEFEDSICYHAEKISQPATQPQKESEPQ